MNILIKKGRLIDPKQDLDKVCDIYVEEGKISKIGENITDKADLSIDAEGKIVAPGFIDMHAHLREPGYEEKETIETGTKAAIKGGFTTVLAMPNTEPPCDNGAQAKFVLERSAKAKKAKVIPVGTMTQKREGKELSQMSELKDAGVVAISDDGDSVEDSGLMRRIMEYASMLDLTVISHCEDRSLAKDGVMNEGYWSTVLGLKPIPSESESIIVERDIQLAELTGARLHIAHVSTKESVDKIRQAKKKGINVTAEVTPHHFSLDDETLKTFDTNLKVNPPLGSKKDITALKKGLRDGTIDVIATDHAPHAVNEKEKEFDYAPFGMIGFETALSLSVEKIIEEGVLDWRGLIEKLATNPGKILKIDPGTLEVGKLADITIIDPEKKWIYEKEKVESRSSNSPFIGKNMKGQVSHVLIEGKMIVKDGEIQ